LAALAARAQKLAPPLIGLHSANSPDPTKYTWRVFWQGLGEIGYVEGRNVRLEYRWITSKLFPFLFP
jgi:putative ABC transport system substrate-binding protein